MRVPTGLEGGVFGGPGVPHRSQTRKRTVGGPENGVGEGEEGAQGKGEGQRKENEEKHCWQICESLIKMACKYASSIQYDLKRKW